MIRLRNVYKSIDAQTNILNDINLELNTGDFLGIFGKSGSGKSTLLNILGLIDESYDGEYLLEGQNIKDMTDLERSNIRNRMMGYVFQSFFLLETMNVFENISLPLLYSKKQYNLEKKVRNCLNKVGLLDKEFSNINLLSGGQKQKVAIARSLIQNPQIIIADEPTGALDSESASEIMNIFNSLNEQGVTIVLVTHDLDNLKYCNKIIEIKDGKIFYDK